MNVVQDEIAVQRLNRKRRLVVEVGEERRSCSTVEREAFASSGCEWDAVAVQRLNGRRLLVVGVGGVRWLGGG